MQAGILGQAFDLVKEEIVSWVHVFLECVLSNLVFHKSAVFSALVSG